MQVTPRPNAKGSYKRAILYLSSHIVAGTKRADISKSSRVRMTAYIWDRPASKVADDIIAFEHKARFGATNHHQEQSFGQ